MKLFECMFGSDSILMNVASAVFVIDTILSIIATSVLLMRYFFSLGGKYVSETTDYPWKEILLTACLLILDSICIWPGIGAFSIHVTLSVMFYFVLYALCIVTAWLTYLAVNYKSHDVSAFFCEVALTGMLIFWSICI